MQRRSFLGSILAAGCAPAFVGAGVLMPVREIWTGPSIITSVGTFRISTPRDGSVLTVIGFDWGPDSWRFGTGVVLQPGETLEADHKTRSWRKLVYRQ